MWNVGYQHNNNGWHLLVIYNISGFPDGSDGKESACNAGDPGSIPGSGRSSGEGNDNPQFVIQNVYESVQYSPEFYLTAEKIL